MSGIRLFDFTQKINYKNELFSGFAVAMTMIPESLSFAILAGFPPLMGVYAAFIMGLITSILGGRPGMISGGAGSTTIVLIALMQKSGLEYVFAAIVLAGLIQLFIGIMKWGKFICLVPKSVMYGFVNGLAIVIFMAQIHQFKINVDGHSQWMHGNELWLMMTLVILTILVVWIFPKITKKFPPTLVAIFAVFAIVYIFHIPTKTVGDIASVAGGFPPFHIPKISFNWQSLQLIFPYSLVMACVGLTEGLLTLNVVDEITASKGNSNRECIAQGIANMTNGFFYGMGGCSMIAQTLVNLNSGSRARLSGIIASLTILIIILVGAPFISKVPMAALTGVMIMVAIETFEWTSFKIIGKMPFADIFIGILVALITVLFSNLALAVLIGVILSALVFAWQNAKKIRVSSFINTSNEKKYTISGPLFFGSTMAFLEAFTIESDPVSIIIDFKSSRIADMSGIDAIQNILNKYASVNKEVHLLNLDDESRLVLEKSGVLITLSN
ncbi:SulP family inorganic anion transporter [Rhizosphaericola mali]|uniref:SulP family inorganic anion transporter n=1 Tax=Rhizosphaericola mali TaxID=2545455 RepID=A0A5P2FY76_9BACT|nr:SulP family inorganic anion transporter [Rhizosphaericola mali]QES88135.1 SulP family inorganic anion transporter [Rhizosphaericola mali]